jgi:6,7-dimethyl-8-ribityllumazine synthase
MRIFEGTLERPAGRFAIVAARFNGVITTKLVHGALEALVQHGVPEHDIDVVWVPGSFEIPLVARRLAAAGGHRAVVCLGAIIRGDTDHYQLVAAEAARGVADAAAASGVPVIFGVLTTETVEQALVRAGPPERNAGAEAARTALRMANLLAQLPPRD